MPWQVFLKQKNGVIHSDFMGGRDITPKVGDVIDYLLDGRILKAKVSSVVPTVRGDGKLVGGEIGQPVYGIHAEEI
jgi:hypothetical protein